MGVSLPPLNKVLFAGIGFFAPPVVEGFLGQFLPTSLTTSTIGKYATRILSVIGLSYAVRKFVGTEEGNMVAIGGGVYVVSSALREFAPGVVPGLGSYVPARSSMGAYVPATNVTAMPIASSAQLPVATVSRFNRLTR